MTSLSPPEFTVVTANPMRRVTGRRMRESLAAHPQVTLHARADAGALLAARERLGVERRAVSITVLLAYVLARTLRDHRRINGRTEDGEIRSYHDVNLGIAVALDEGLLVPVIPRADTKSLDELAGELADLSRRAAARKLHPTELADGTFTLTNLGTFGVEWFTPIINPPQMAILGVGKLLEIPQIADGQLRTARFLPLSLTFDHAAVDGAPAGRFLQLLTSGIEAFGSSAADQPALMAPDIPSRLQPSATP